jgi:nitrite reductase/ring-hydroxylating ferredoxin subunit
MEPRVLCRIADIPEDGAKGFAGPDGSFTGLVAVRRGEGVFVYENACPHIGTPLDWTPDRFLSRDGQHLICATHGALFEIGTGVCIAGPCLGDRLTPVDFHIRDGAIVVGPLPHGTQETLRVGS